MELIDNHIQKYLNDFLNEVNPSFEEVFTKIQNEKKEEYKSLIIYIERILDLSINENENKISIIHLHFEYDFEYEIKSVINEH